MFAGAGGGILAGSILGWRTVCAVERDSYAAAVLAARQNDKTLEAFPVWDDVSTFDGRPWRGIVDVISGGFPCQDISVAGKGGGIKGERSGLWGEFARIIGEVRPRYVLVENSPMLVSRGLGRVLVTWPRWGMMRDGVSYPQPTPSGLLAIRALITSESASGSSQQAPTPTVNGNHNRKGLTARSGDGLATWVSQRFQTPVADDASNRVAGKINSRGEAKLSAQVLRMPTPTAMMTGDTTSVEAFEARIARAKAKHNNGNGAGQDLAMAVKRMPTSVASAARGSSPATLTRKDGKDRSGDRLDHAVMASHGGQLSADWTEWLMGWPTGWTALEPLATDRFPLWSRSHGTFSEARTMFEQMRRRAMPWTRAG